MDKIKKTVTLNHCIKTITSLAFASCPRSPFWTIPSLEVADARCLHSENSVKTSLKLIVVY